MRRFFSPMIAYRQKNIAQILVFFNTNINGYRAAVIIKPAVITNKVLPFSNGASQLWRWFDCETNGHHPLLVHYLIYSPFLPMLTNIYKNNFMLYLMWLNIIDGAHEVIMKIVTEHSIFYIQSMKAYINVHIWTINHQEPWTATLKAIWFYYEPWWTVESTHW